MFVFLLLLYPPIGIAMACASLPLFFAFRVWIAWRVFLERVLKREPGLYRVGG